MIAPADRNQIVGHHHAGGGVSRKREERAHDRLPALWRRLELTGGCEHARWQAAATTRGSTQAKANA